MADEVRIATKPKLAARIASGGVVLLSVTIGAILNVLVTNWDWLLFLALVVPLLLIWLVLDWWLAGKRHFGSSTSSHTKQHDFDARADRLAHASREADARRIARLTSAGVPQDKISSIVEWMDSLGTATISAPQGKLRVLVAPMGAGKTEIAHRWFLEGLREAESDSAARIPIWLDIRSTMSDFRGVLGTKIAPEDWTGPCRIVLDRLDNAGVEESRQVLSDARELAALWPGVQILVTARPGLPLVQQDELLEVDEWPEGRGNELLELVTGERMPSDMHVPEVLESLRRPLSTLAIAQRIRAGTPASAQVWDLLSSLAEYVIELNRGDDAHDALWDSLRRLAKTILASDAPVLANQFSPLPGVWTLTDSGLVITIDNALSFALPAFEQYFGAQAILQGEQRFEDSVAMNAFPKWRYAVALAIASAPDKADTRLARIARTNPAAASWLLDELGSGLITPDPQRGLWDQASTPGAEDDEPSAEVVLGTWLRDAQQAWLDGLGPLGRQLARHGPDHRPVRWGVWLFDDSQHMTVAEADTATEAPEVVALDEPRPAIIKSGWARSTHGSVPTPPLGRWLWTRAQLRSQLERLLQRRTLPCPTESPIARERLWFLAQLIATGRPRPRHEPIPTEQLKSQVAEMLTHAEDSRRSTWNISGYEVDQDDIHWLDAVLSTVTDTHLRRPAPVPDRPGRFRSASELYSPQRTLDLATEALQAAVVGYRDLVEANFAPFGQALGLFSAFPLEVDGIVEIDNDSPLGLETGLIYSIRHATDTNNRTTPLVNLELNVGRARSDGLFTTLWTEHKRIPTSRRQRFGHRGINTLSATVLDVYHARPATNLAYKWLTSDLRALGWVDRHLQFYN